LRCCKQWLFT